MHFLKVKLKRTVLLIRKLAVGYSEYLVVKNYYPIIKNAVTVVY